MLPGFSPFFHYQHVSKAFYFYIEGRQLWNNHILVTLKQTSIYNYPIKKCINCITFIHFYSWIQVIWYITTYILKKLKFKLLPMNQIFNIYKLTWFYWFYNGFEDYSICHLNWQCSGYNVFSVYIYLPVICIHEIFSGWVRWFINQRQK